MYSYIELNKQTSFPSANTGKVIIGSNANGVLNVTDENGNTSLLEPETPQVNYYVYTAKLTQAGGNAPVATVLENTLPFTPNWEYSDIGVYFFNIDTGNPGRITCYIGPTSTATLLSQLFSDVLGGVVHLDSIDMDGNQDDNLLNNTPVEIRLYK